MLSLVSASQPATPPVTSTSLTMFTGGSSVEPSTLQVDYDVNITPLYEAICNCDWDLAVESVRKNPEEARTWVVRHYQDNEEEGEEKEIMWRFLPIHSACARDPPAFVISALLKAYPDGAHCVDDQGMYALHYACGNQASREVIRLLLVANSMAAKCADPRGMLPIHYLACWGPSTVSIIDMVMVANRDVGKAQDNDGNTPLDLAMEGDYPERDQVVIVLKRWLEKTLSSRNLTSGTPERPTTRSATPTKKVEEAAAAALVPAEPTDAEKEEHPADEVQEDDAAQAKDAEEENPVPSIDTQEGEEQGDDAPQEDGIPPAPQDGVAAASPRLAVDTAVDDQVEVNICPTPLSPVESNETPHENENAPTIITTTRGAEEKGEPSSSTSTAIQFCPSPRTVSRLRHEVTKLRMEKNQSEAEWEHKLTTSVNALDAKCNEMVHKVEELKLALTEANTKIATLEEESTQKDQCILDTEHQLSDALERIEGVEQDCIERIAMAEEEGHSLKKDLAELEMENAKLAKEMENRNERLYSLTSTIDTMMERHEMLMQAVNEKNAQLTEASQARRQNLKMLFDMEQEFMEAVMGDETPDFEKQMKEMEALRAMIDTMKD